MPLIKEISIQNFKCYRRSQKFPLDQSNFFIGANNAGKSAVLKAVHCFFDDSQYQAEFINKTELRSKGTGFNKTIIGITFDLDKITTKTLRGNLKAEYGETITLYKNFTFRETTNSIIIDYTLNEETANLDNLNPNLLDFLSRISVSYLHPHEAKELLEKAQEKLKSRLLSNWGRNSAIKDVLGGLQEQWAELRKKANSYLSNGLTQSLQNIWPGCDTKVDLPERVEEIIGVSEIIFKGSPELPDVSLTSQGTGAQSTILYQTHFLLDSDKTLHRGFYYPVWLIEEPESFLHADIIFKLGSLLCSDTWMNNIQMLISTHSPLLLATSKHNGDRIMWYTISNHNILKNNIVSEWTDADIREIGVLMGDPNFDIYFQTSENATPIIIEDSKEITERKFIEAGIHVTKRLKGASELRRYFDVLRSVNISLNRNIYFLVDNDEGVKEFSSSLQKGQVVARTDSGFTSYSFENNVHLIVFPEGFAVEELFAEHDDVLESCANQIFNGEFTKATNTSVPANLTRAHAAIRNKHLNGIDEAKNSIRNQQDVKDIFWQKVEENHWRINSKFASELKELLD